MHGNAQSQWENDTATRDQSEKRDMNRGPGRGTIPCANGMGERKVNWSLMAECFFIESTSVPDDIASRANPRTGGIFTN